MLSETSKHNIDYRLHTLLSDHTPLISQTHTGLGTASQMHSETFKKQNFDFNHVGALRQVEDKVMDYRFKKKSEV